MEQQQIAGVARYAVVRSARRTDAALGGSRSANKRSQVGPDRDDHGHRPHRLIVATKAGDLRQCVAPSPAVGADGGDQEDRAESIYARIGCGETAGSHDPNVPAIPVMPWLLLAATAHGACANSSTRVPVAVSHASRDAVDAALADTAELREDRWLITRPVSPSGLLLVAWNVRAEVAIRRSYSGRRRAHRQLPTSGRSIGWLVAVLARAGGAATVVGVWAALLADRDSGASAGGYRCVTAGQPPAGWIDDPIRVAGDSPGRGTASRSHARSGQRTGQPWAWSGWSP